MENVAPGFRGHHSFIATALFQMIKRRPVHSSLILQWSGLCITIDLTWLALSEDEYDVLGLGLGVIVTYWGAMNGAVGESTRLPPMWPRFKSGRRSHMWVEFVVGSLPCSERFYSGTPVFPSPQKPTFPNSNSTRNQVHKEPLCGCATSKLFFKCQTYFSAQFQDIKLNKVMFFRAD